MDLVTNLTRLAAAFPRDNATEATLAVYVEELSRLDQETLAYVLRDTMRSATKFPTLSEILQNYNAARRRERENAKDNVAALPMGSVPMPPEIKAEIRRTLQRFDERAEVLEEDA
jgi:hypothetical protein